MNVNKGDQVAKFKRMVTVRKVTPKRIHTSFWEFTREGKRNQN